MNEYFRRRLLIADQSLRDLDGHHFEYDFAVAEAARSLGLEPVILVNLDYRAGDALGAPVVPWFEQDWLTARRSPAARYLLYLLARLPAGLRRLLIGIGGDAKRLLTRHGGLRKVPALPSFGRELHAGLTLPSASPVLILALGWAGLALSLAVVGWLVWTYRDAIISKFGRGNPRPPRRRSQYVNGREKDSGRDDQSEHHAG